GDDVDGAAAGAGAAIRERGCTLGPGKGCCAGPEGVGGGRKYGGLGLVNGKRCGSQGDDGTEGVIVQHQIISTDSDVPGATRIILEGGMDNVKLRRIQIAVNATRGGDDPTLGNGVVEVEGGSRRITRRRQRIDVNRKLAAAIQGTEIKCATNVQPAPASGASHRPGPVVDVPNIGAAAVESHVAGVGESSDRVQCFNGAVNGGITNDCAHAVQGLGHTDSQTARAQEAAIQGRAGGN